MKIRWTRQALADLDAALDWIAEDNPAAAGEVAGLLEGAVSHLAAHPEIGRSGRVSGTRELIVPRTPYIVVYRVAATHVDILAVLHTARKWPDGF